jgi:hypothetical protein
MVDVNEATSNFSIDGFEVESTRSACKAMMKHTSFPGGLAALIFCQDKLRRLAIN